MRLKTVLKKAAWLIHERGFCRGQIRSSDGRFCALGAITKVMPPDACFGVDGSFDEGTALMFFNDMIAVDKHDVASILYSLSEEK